MGLTIWLGLQDPPKTLDFKSSMGELTLQMAITKVAHQEDHSLLVMVALTMYMLIPVLIIPVPAYKSSSFKREEILVQRNHLASGTAERAVVNLRLSTHKACDQHTIKVKPFWNLSRIKPRSLRH